MHFERDLNEAFSIPIPEDLESRIVLRQSIEADVSSRQRNWLFFAIVATFVLVVGLTLLIFKPLSEPGLEQIALDFYNRNNSVLAVSQPTAVESARLLLSENGITMKNNIGKIVYANRCYIREGKGIHLVIAGTNGPVTLVYMPEESVDKKMLFANKYSHGIIAPCPRGSIAIIASPEEDIEKIKSHIFKSIKWV